MMFKLFVFMPIIQTLSNNNVILKEFKLGGGVSDRPPVTDLRSTVQSSLKEQTFNANS